MHKGLSSADAKKKQQQVGFNEIIEDFHVTPLRIFLRQIKNNFALYLLFFAALISLYVDKASTAIAISTVILLVVFIGFIQDYRAERSVQSLRTLLVPTTMIIRDAREQRIASRELVPDDIILLRSGDRVPADAIVIEETQLRLNESMLSGESVAIPKVIGRGTATEKNTLYMGTFVANGKCLARVLHTGMNTRFGHISSLITHSEKELPLQHKVNSIAKYMATVGIIISLMTGAIILLQSQPSPTLLVDTLILMIALAISSFPEGFPVVLITALSYGAHEMAKRNVIVNRISIIETLGETTVICADKTGTITTGEMSVRQAIAADKAYTLSGDSASGKALFLSQGKEANPRNDPALHLLCTGAVLCNDAKIQKQNGTIKTIGSPTESALLVMAANAGIFHEDMHAERLEEIPFSSERKIMSILCHYKNQHMVFSKGAPEVLLQKCSYVQKQQGNASRFIRLSSAEKQKIIEMQDRLTSKAYRTLAIAYKKVKAGSARGLSMEEDLIFLGIIAMEDPPRDEVKESIAECKRAGIAVKMVTGDNHKTALSIARQIGLSGKIMESSRLKDLSIDELASVISEYSIFARVSPEHKLKIVQALKKNGEIVTMTGDGVNDAPALKEAHIGVAMGKNGTDVSRAVADLTLKDDNFASIVAAIEEGRTIFKNIRKFVAYQLSANYAELITLFVGVALSSWLGWQIPVLLAMQILFMNLVTDDLSAITLAVIPHSQDIMLEKPRKRSILNASLKVWLAIAGVCMALFTLISLYVAYNLLHFSFEQARTVAFVALILLELANAYNFLSLRQGVNLASLRVNKYLLYASLLSIAATLAALYTPLRHFFATVPLPLEGWLVALSVSVFIIFIFNVLKKANQRYKLLDLDE